MKNQENTTSVKGLSDNASAYDLEKSTAVHTLIDEIWPIEEAIEVIGYIVQELQEGYFEHYCRDNIITDDDRKGIVIDFMRNRAKAKIISEYQFKIRQALQEITDLGALSD